MTSESGAATSPETAAVGMEEAKEPSSTKLILTLGIAGLLSGLAIVGAYEITLPTILENKARELEAAVLEVVPGSTTMEKMSWNGEALVKSGDESGSAAPSSEGGEGSEVIYAAYGDDGSFRGYAIPGEGNGFQDVIKLIYGFEPTTRRIIGMRVLESRETPGLGDKIFKDVAFVENFDALAVDPTIELTKEKTKENQVDAITGATISSRAVVKILNTANERWLTRLPETEGESS